MLRCSRRVMCSDRRRSCWNGTAFALYSPVTTSAARIPPAQHLNSFPATSSLRRPPLAFRSLGIHRSNRKLRVLSTRCVNHRTVGTSSAPTRWEKRNALSRNCGGPGMMRRSFCMEQPNGYAMFIDPPVSNWEICDRHLRNPSAERHPALSSVLRPHSETGGQENSAMRFTRWRAVGCRSRAASVNAESNCL